VKNHVCYAAYGLLLFVTVIAVYLWESYVSLFEDETAYLYNPETTEMFEIKMTHSISPIHIWDSLNPFVPVKRRVPGVSTYLGRLPELRDDIRQQNRNLDSLQLKPDVLEFKLDAPASSISLEYFRFDDGWLDSDLIPDEWQDVVTRDSADVISAHAVFIKQEWPDGYLGDAIWPVEVSLASDVIIFFGRSANELCVKELTRGFPQLEGVVREVGCFFPS
jgi:hypothetical protein